MKKPIKQFLALIKPFKCINSLLKTLRWRVWSRSWDPLLQQVLTEWWSVAESDQTGSEVWQLIHQHVSHAPLPLSLPLQPELPRQVSQYSLALSQLQVTFLYKDWTNNTSVLHDYLIIGQVWKIKAKRMFHAQPLRLWHDHSPVLISNSSVAENQSYVMKQLHVNVFDVFINRFT